MGEAGATVQVVGAVTADDEQALLPQSPDQECEQVAGGLVGPVQILDGEQRRPVAVEAGFGQSARDAVEELKLTELATGCGDSAEPKPGASAPGRQVVVWNAVVMSGPSASVNGR